MSFNKQINSKFFVLFLSVLAIFFLLKIIAFEFGLYRTDIIQFLQISRDWFFGKPFYYDNMHQSNLKLHGVYLAPLVGVLTIPFGAYGLIGALLIVWILCLWASLKFIPHNSKSIFLLIFIFAGPLLYYIIDDAVFGFHLELVFAPLAILYTISLVKKQLYLSFVIGLVLFLIRQDGIVLACLLHLQVLAFLWADGQIPASRFLIKFTKIGLFYFLSFVLVLFSIHFFSSDPVENHRVSQSIARIAELLEEGAKGLFIYLFYLLFRAIFFISPFFLLFFYFCNKKQIIITTIGLLILFIIHFISGARYIPNIEFSITWAPRYASIYGFLVSALLLAYYFQFNKHEQNAASENSILQIKRREIGVFVLAYALQFVAYTSAYTRFVFAPVMPRIEWQETTPAKIVDVLLKGDSQFSRTFHQMGDKFRAVAAGLPEFYPIALSNYLHTYFHRHDTIFLPARRFQSAWRMPRAVIVDNSEYSIEEIAEMQALLPDSRSFEINGFTLIVVPEDVVYFSELLQNPS